MITADFGLGTGQVCRKSKKINKTDFPSPLSYFLPTNVEEEDRVAGDAWRQIIVNGQKDHSSF